MSSNSTFSRAFACLSHPLSLGAMAVLLLNDHLFRIHWPGWWTGKLGDFAWLFFFPFAAAVVLSWIVPQKWKHSERWVAFLALVLPGSIFALAKTWHPFHSWLVGSASDLFGWTVGWRLDPTDLIALTSLIGAAWLWRHSAHKPAQQPKPVWLLLGLVGFLTLANSPMPEVGITCLEVSDNQVVAFSSYSTYRSEPGGLVWREAGAEMMGQVWSRERCNPFLSESMPDTQEWQDPTNAAVIYRIKRGEAIERSQDGGQTWQVDLQLKPDTEAMRAYYMLRGSGNAEYFTGPFDVAFDPSTGNLILAMGHSGVLVRQSGGSYTWAAVGIHQHEEPGISQVFFILFPGEAVMAAILGGLSVMVLALRQRRFSFRHVITGISALAWLFVGLLLPPALTYGYGNAVVMLALAASGILLLPLVIEAFIRAGIASRKLLLRNVLVLLVSIVLFFLPFITWGLNTLPNYRLAQVIAVVLAAGWVYWQHRKTYLDQR
jgi:hypothetical protein